MLECEGLRVIKGAISALIDGHKDLSWLCDISTLRFIEVYQPLFLIITREA